MPRTPLKSRARDVVSFGGQERYALTNLREAMRQAKRATTRGVQRSGNATDGAKLKAKMLKMARRSGASPEELREIERMDDATLDSFGASNKYAMDVMFNYGSVERLGDYSRATSESRDNVRFVIQEYNRYIGRS